MRPFLTHEVGSLAKPIWRVKAIRNEELKDEDINEAIKWAKILEIKDQIEPLLVLLKKRKNFTIEEKKEIISFSSFYATKLLEKTGIDLIFDGEQHRAEMYEYPIKNIEGFEFRGYVRSFDYKFFKKAACIGEIKLKNFYHEEEFKKIQTFTNKPIKIPITGAYTLVDWSFDEYFIKKINYEKNTKLKKLYAKQNFLKEISDKIIHPILLNLKELGAKFIQIDEPASSAKPNELNLFFDSLTNSIKETYKDIFYTIHICFSNYRLLFPYLPRIQNIVKELHLEFANRDTTELGLSDKKRIGYELLDELKNYNFIIGLGVLNVHTDFVEPIELIKDRILYAYEKIKDPHKIFIAPDCGLRTRSWEIAFKKLTNMVEARNLAIKEIGL